MASQQLAPSRKRPRVARPAKAEVDAAPGRGKGESKSEGSARGKRARASEDASGGSLRPRPGAALATSPVSSMMATLEMLRKRNANSDQEEMAKLRTISYRSLQRAQTTIEDFVKSYYCLHALPLTSFLKHFPILIFIEATIYELDELNEDQTRLGLEKSPAVFHRLHGALVRVLEQKGLYDPKVREELKKGMDYWKGERVVCKALSKQPAEDFSLENALSVSLNKSFDYRILHRLLCLLENKAYNDDLFEVMYYNEHLVDIADDLYDYETDVERNSFNILRCYVKKHGKDASLHLAARISDFEKKYDEALKRLDAPLREAHVKREKTAMDESKATTWVFPPLILDEAAHRRQ